jgi:hypothetical protein
MADREYSVTEYNRRMAGRVASRAGLDPDSAVCVAFAFNNLATMFTFGLLEDVARLIPGFGELAELAVGVLGFYFHRIVLVTQENVYVFRDLPFHQPGAMLMKQRREPGIVRLGTTSRSWITRFVYRGQLWFQDGTIVYHSIWWIRRVQYVAQEANIPARRYV